MIHPTNHLSAIISIKPSICSSSLSSFIAKRGTERQYALPHDNRVSLSFHPPISPKSRIPIHLSIPIQSCIYPSTHKSINPLIPTSTYLFIGQAVEDKDEQSLQTVENCKDVSHEQRCLIDVEKTSSPRRSQQDHQCDSAPHKRPNYIQLDVTGSGHLEPNCRGDLDPHHFKFPFISSYTAQLYSCVQCCFYFYDDDCQHHHISPDHRHH